MSKNILVGIGLVAALLVTTVLASGTEVFAQAGAIQDGVNSISSGQSKPLMQTVGDLINVFLFLLGAVAVVMVIFGGFKYVTSAGDSSAVTSAKNTILYAVVGLVVAASAYAIVNFALGRFNDSSTPETAFTSTEQMRGGVINQ
jgi:ABC-type Co2+ transport system permease subunit